MRLLAASDLHGNRAMYRALPEVARKHDVGAIVLAGDLLGDSDDAPALIDALSLCRQPVFYIMGNDDPIELGIDTESIRSIHLRRFALGEYNVVGYQCTLPFMGGATERPETEIGRDLQGIASLVDEHSILVTHGPARGVLDRTRLGNAGSTSLAILIETRRPRLHIHGHIHECFGRSGIHFNVAAGWKMRAMVIDVDRLEHSEIDIPG
jgi:Icc-related predicted phosphoesterase